MAATNAVAQADTDLAFSEKFVIRLSSYGVREADTDLTVLSSALIGSGFNFVDDLGGEESVRVPRLDGHFRLDTVHRIEFSSFRFERKGFNRLAIDLDIGDQSYSIGDSVVSEISYELNRLGYAYSFHRSQDVELSVTLGLNQTTYRFEYELVDGTSADTSEASGPLPMFGFRVSYRIDPRWSLHYLSEVLFIESGDAEGSFQNLEINLRYRFDKRIMLGAGWNRSSIDVTTEDPDWRGRIADTYQAFVFSGSYYLD